LNRVELTNI
jgi:NAD(P)-dependent dehydrogenase (short-subunit alcohol dehydrogenase family)